MQPFLPGSCGWGFRGFDLRALLLVINADADAEARSVVAWARFCFLFLFLPALLLSCSAVWRGVWLVGQAAGAPVEHSLSAPLFEPTCDVAPLPDHLLLVFWCQNFPESLTIHSTDT